LLPFLCVVIAETRKQAVAVSTTRALQTL